MAHPFSHGSNKRVLTAVHTPWGTWPPAALLLHCRCRLCPAHCRPLHDLRRPPLPLGAPLGPASTSKSLGKQHLHQGASCDLPTLSLSPVEDTQRAPRQRPQRLPLNSASSGKRSAAAAKDKQPQPLARCFSATGDPSSSAGSPCKVQGSSRSPDSPSQERTKAPRASPLLLPRTMLAPSVSRDAAGIIASFGRRFGPFFFLTMGHFLHPFLPLPGITSQINHPLPNPCVRLRCGDVGVGDLNERTSFHDIPASLTQLSFVPRGSRPPPDYVQLTRCASFSRTSIEAPWKRGVLCAVSTDLSSAPTYNTSWHRVVAPLYICVGY